MNNQELFIEWYVRQINPRTGRPYHEASANTYINFIRRLVNAELVRNNIFDVDADEFDRQINEAQRAYPNEFAVLENHGSLKNGIRWWRRFLQARIGR